MSDQLTMIERAYELAREGRAENVTEIRKALRSEGYTSVEAGLQGSALGKDLRRLAAEARAGRTARLCS